MKVLNAYGIHARPAAMFVKTANRFSSDISVEHKGTKVSAKSIMGLLTIEGHHGAVLTVDACGSDAVDALDALEELFIKKFNED
jgi:phosphocarrier protein